MTWQHLDPLNQSCVTGGTGSADGIVGPSDTHIDGNFTCRVIGDSTWIVVVCPIACIVVKFGNVVDFVLSFYIPVFYCLLLREHSK